MQMLGIQAIVEGRPHTYDALYEILKVLSGLKICKRFKTLYNLPLLFLPLLFLQLHLFFPAINQFVHTQNRQKTNLFILSEISVEHDRLCFEPFLDTLVVHLE